MRTWVVSSTKRGLPDRELARTADTGRCCRLGSARQGNSYVFLHGFSKSEKANVTQGETKALQFAGKVFLELTDEALNRALQAGVLQEVYCEQDY